MEFVVLHMQTWIGHADPPARGLPICRDTVPDYSVHRERTYNLPTV